MHFFVGKLLLLLDFRVQVYYFSTQAGQNKIVFMNEPRLTHFFVVG